MLNDTNIRGLDAMSHGMTQSKAVSLSFFQFFHHRIDKESGRGCRIGGGRFLTQFPQGLFEFVIIFRLMVGHNTIAHGLFDIAMSFGNLVLIVCPLWDRLLVGFRVVGIIIRHSKSITNNHLGTCGGKFVTRQDKGFENAFDKFCGWVAAYGRCRNDNGQQIGQGRQGGLFSFLGDLILLCRWNVTKGILLLFSIILVVLSGGLG
mmetsp:Transcript_23996/g.49882  ORF Transcript_23996/g.49882 Transcript_23996/m.49882 type:complete len:205 (+) Transcript_23996:980-1594(+)